MIIYVYGNETYIHEVVLHTLSVIYLSLLVVNRHRDDIMALCDILTENKEDRQFDSTVITGDTVRCDENCDN